MNIAVCLKQVPDISEVRMKEDYTLDRAGASQRISPSDEAALELALRTKEQLGGTVTVLSMGPERAENALREAVARGAERAVLLSDASFAGSDSLITARCLAAAIRKLGDIGLVLCGRRTLDGETGQVGPMLASLLDFPCLPNLIRADIGEEITGTQLTGEGMRIFTCGTPAVLTVCEGSCVLRLPGLMGLRRAARTEIERWTRESLKLETEECGLSASPTRVVRVAAAQDGGRRCRFVTGVQLVNVLGKAKVRP